MKWVLDVLGTKITAVGCLHPPNASTLKIHVVVKTGMLECIVGWVGKIDKVVFEDVK